MSTLEKAIKTGDYCMLGVRLFHVLLGVLLVVNAIVFWGKTDNDVWSKVLLAGLGMLGLGAAAYHGFRAFVQAGFVC